MAEFFARLRQRKLVQWALAYVAFAFALLQGVDIVAQRFAWPEAVERGLIVVLAIGFLVALVLAWYHGERGVQKASGTELLILAVLLAIGGGMMWRFARAPKAAAPSTAQPAAAQAQAAVADSKSIAVLPFTSMSPGQDNAYFADGLSEEIINSLSRVPDLKVAARTSSFALRDSKATVPELAAKLHVATVLEGSVRSGDDKLRIGVQLIRAADGYELWSETYDRSNQDIIAIQEDVAREIAQALKTAVDPVALAAMQRAGTRSVAAYQAFLRGLALSQQAIHDSQYGLNSDALAAFNHAIELDPEFADAYARAADLEWSLLRTSSLGSAEAKILNYADRQQSLRVDLDRASANARNASERAYYDALRAAIDIRYIDAIRLMRQYVREYPNSPSGYDYIANWSLYRGDYAAASDVAEAMGRLRLGQPSADSPVSYLVWAGEAKRAEYYARLDLKNDPDGVETVYQAHRALLTAGAVQEAAKLVPQLLASQLSPLSKALVQVRQACAEGRVENARRLYAGMAGIDDPTTAERWNALQLLGRPAEANRLLAYMDTPIYFNALSSFLVYPYFDVSHFPNLQKVLLDQGIQRPPPHREPYACRLEATG